MPKKCPPGVFCIENMTLFLLFVFGAIILYLLYSNISINKQVVVSKQIVHEHDPLRSISTRHDVFNDPYAPPILEVIVVIFAVFLLILKLAE